MLRHPNGVIERCKADGDTITRSHQCQLGIGEVHLGAGHIDLGSRPYLEEAAGPLQTLDIPPHSFLIDLHQASGEEIGVVG